jgi:predicted permease
MGRIWERVGRRHPLQWLGSALEDVRYGLRLIRRNRVLSGVVVLTLTLGIGMNVSVLGVLNAIALRARVEKPETFFRVFPEDRGGGMAGRSDRAATRAVSHTEYLAYRNGSRTVSQLVAWSFTEVNLGKDDRTEMGALLVSCNFFSVDGPERARYGRLFLPGECSTPGQAPVAVLSEETWRSRFGGNPRLIGGTISINGRAFTVVGIAPNSTGAWARHAGVWLPYTVQPYLEPQRSLFVESDPVWLWLAGRLAPGFSRREVQAELSLLARQQDRLHPGRNTGMRVTDGSRIREPGMGSRAFWMVGLIMGAVSLVLLISCANVTTLLLSRAASRQQEIAVRLALGAARGRLLRMLLTESLLLAAAAGLASIYIAYHVPELLMQFLTKQPPEFSLSPDWRIFAYIAGVVLVTGCLAGLAPALGSLRVDLAASLKGQGSLFGSSASPSWLRGFLVSAQVALSLVLLVEAGVFGRAQYRNFGTDPGYETRKVLVARLRFPAGNSRAASGATFRQVAERVESLPEVRSIAYANNIPFLGQLTMDMRPSGQEPGAARPVDLNGASPKYFETLGIPIVQGREFRDSDMATGGSAVPVIVSETLASRYYPNQDPIGKRLELVQGSMQVIGVARDVNRTSYGGTGNPVAYWLGPPSGQQTFLLVRFEGAGQAAADAVRVAVREVDPELVVVPRSLQAGIDEDASNLWNVVVLVEILGSVAVLLALTGIYGVVAFTVTQKARDLGIRVALGAQRTDIIREVAWCGAKPVVRGLLAGLGLSLAGAGVLRQAFQSAQFRLETGDPLVYAGAVVLLGLASFLAMSGPARRAALADPLSTLRCE